MRLYGDIQKIDAEKRMVWGYASTEAKDRVGETVLKSAIEGALDDYLTCGNIREMHQLSAVGTAQEAEMTAKGLYLGAHIVDDNAWSKVINKVYKGFSIGGKVLGRDTLDKTIVTAVRLDEISLVDRPANPEAVFDMWKAAGAESPTIEVEGGGSDSTGTSGSGGDSVAAANEGDLTKTTEVTIGEVTSGEETSKAGVASEGTAEVTPEAGAASYTPAVEEGGEVDKTVEVDPPAPVEDPITKATNAVAALETAVNAIAPQPEATSETNTFGKGLYTVSNFADLLSAIGYLVSDTQDEADWEGDNSTIPASLRSWLAQGASIFVSMAAEEVNELLARLNTSKTVAAEDLAKTIEAEVLAKTTATANEATEEQLRKTLSENEDLQKALSTITEKVEPLVKTVEALGERLAKVEQQPLPGKTAGPGVVAIHATPLEKGVDSTGQGDGANISEDDLAKALGAMSKEDQTLLLIKAAQQYPRRVTYK